MFWKVVCAIFVLVPANVFCAERGSACTTPNGETAKCIGISSCKVIVEAVLTRNKNAIEFAKSSNCGMDNEPLVCCGSKAFINEFRNANEASSCTTPNKETATCTPLTSCKVILDATATSNKEATEFAEMSRCNNTGGEHLVCCGSEGYFYQGSPLLPKRNYCGFQKSKNRVTGGELTEIGEFPWMALLRYKYFDGTDAGFKCGGTLINNRYILTAAHCVAVGPSKNFALDSVRLGEWKISTERDCEEGIINDECADPVVDIKIKQKIINPEYNPITKKNDIALLRLESSVKYSDYIIPICLPHPHSAFLSPGSQLVISGWGATENNSFPDIKLKADVPVVSTSDCSSKIRHRGPITDKQICAGGASIKDSCQGDSGGPLMGLFEHDVKKRQQWYQEGIVSWGSGCGIVGIPAVYTRVSMYVEWIINNLSD